MGSVRYTRLPMLLKPVLAIRWVRDERHTETLESHQNYGCVLCGVNVVQGKLAVLRDACFRKGNVAACKTLAFFGIEVSVPGCQSPGLVLKKQALSNLANLTGSFAANCPPIKTVCSDPMGDLASKSDGIRKSGFSNTLCFLMGVI
jgi:hypothetical protein